MKDGKGIIPLSNSVICIAPLRLKKDNNYKTVLGLPLWPLVLKKENMTTYIQITFLGLPLWPTVAGKKRTHDLKTNIDK